MKTLAGLPVLEARRCTPGDTPIYNATLTSLEEAFRVG